MTFDDFVGQVQNRAKLASKDEALKAIRATFETLGERLAGGEPRDLASQLPAEIGAYLGDALTSGAGDPFDLREFFYRTSLREEVRLPDSTVHARCVTEVLSEAVSPGALADARAQLPPDYNALFESGSAGELKAGKQQESSEEGFRKAA